MNDNTEHNTIRTNPLAMIFVLFFLVVFLGIGIYHLYLGLSTKSKGDDITVTISHIETTMHNSGSGTHKRTKIKYKVYVNYTYNDIEYKNIRYNAYTSDMTKGETINAKINPNNPREFYYSSYNIKSGIKNLAIALFIGVIFIFAWREKED